MTLRHCANCSTAYAAGAPCCPQCRSTKRKDDGVTLKINAQGVVSDSAAVPAAAQAPQVHHGYHHGQRGTVVTAAAPSPVQEHPGTGVPMTGIEHPADGTMSPLVSNDDPVSEPAPHLAPHPPEGVQLPPVRPPRRPPRPVPGGE